MDLKHDDCVTVEASGGDLFAGRVVGEPEPSGRPDLMRVTLFVSTQPYGRAEWAGGSGAQPEPSE